MKSARTNAKDRSNSEPINEMTDFRSIALLTEHFGFPPLTLIDEVINAVNDIMYKCTQAMETYLNEKREEMIERAIKKGDSKSPKTTSKTQRRDAESEINNEIQIGTGKLETLLESQVDKNFDKFELYSLRNIFMIPPDLIQEGWVRLKHHEGLNLEAAEESKDLDSEIEELVYSICLELNLRKILKLQISKAKKLLPILRQYKQCIDFLDYSSDKNELSAEAKVALVSLNPLDENIYFLFSQVDELIQQVQGLYNRLTKNMAEGGIKDMQFTSTSRDRYVQGKSYMLLESIGVLDPMDYTHSQDDSLDIVESTNLSMVEAAKSISTKIKSMKADT